MRQLLAACWTESARAEHASVAAFARLSLTLVAMGAPGKLLLNRAAQRGTEDGAAVARYALDVAALRQASAAGCPAMTVAHMIRVLLARFDLIVLVYFLLVNTMYAMLLASAAIEIRRHLLRLRSESRWRLADLPPAGTRHLAARHDRQPCLLRP